MAQIPSLPIDEPVARQKARPAEFASPGETIAALGQETEQLALGNQAFEGHLIYAQRQLKYKQIEIDVERLENEAHDKLNQTVTPEDAQAVHAHFKQEVDDALTPYMGDRAMARELHIYSQQADVTMQNTVNARKATLIKRGDDAANKVLYKSSVQESVNIGVAGGDYKVAEAKLEAKLQSSVAMGTLMPDQVDAIMQNFGKDVQKGIIKAGYNSPDPATRKKTIEQLKDGSNFPNLDDADLNAMLSSAEKRDRELSNLRTSENYNAAVNTFDELSQGWTYEGKVNALNDGKWLKANGFVDENGEPDRKTAKMLLEEADRQETRSRKIQSDKDEGIISKHVTEVENGRMSDPKIDQMVREEGGSEKAASVLKSAMRQSVRDAKLLSGGGGSGSDHKAVAKRGESTSADIYTRIAKGETVNRVDDIWGEVEQGNLTVSQAKKLEASWAKHQREDYKRNLTKLSNAPGMTQENFTKLSTELTDATDKQGLEGKALDDFTDSLLKEQGKQETVNYIDKWWGNLKQGKNIWEDSTQSAAKATTKPTMPQPIKGDSKLYKGDVYEFDGTKWVKH